MLLFTIFIILCFFLCSYFLFDKDFFSPPTVVSLGLLFGSICTLYNEKRWGLLFSSYTTLVIAVGIGSFIIGGVIAVVLSNGLKHPTLRISHNTNSVEVIKIDTYKTVVLVLIQIVLLILLFMKEQSVTGYSDWVSVVTEWRRITTNQESLSNPAIRMSGLFRLFLQFNLAIGFVYIYIVANNFATRKRQNFFDWLPIVLCIALTFLQGYRGEMLRMWVMLLVIVYVLWRRTNGWKNNKDIAKLIVYMGLSALAIALVFVAARKTVGRVSSIDPLEYVTFYAGCPLAALDQYLKLKHIPSHIWGKESFYDLNQSLAYITGNEDLRYIFYKEFIQSPNRTFIGNVYTAFRPPYADFGGLIGVAVYMILFGCFFTFLYMKIRDRNGNNPIDLWLLLYAYISYTYFMYFYNLYNSFLTHLFLRLVAELLALRLFLIQINLNDLRRMVIRKKKM